MSQRLLSDETLFAGALARSAQERAAFLAQACSGDIATLARIVELLRAHEAAGQGFMATVAEPRVVEPEVGGRIDRYRLLQKLGEGGCGVVFMAEQQEPVVRRVALKAIKLGMDTKEVIARFNAERQALARMDHPNIARVLDAGTTDAGRPFFVMELVWGQPITKYCDEQNLPTRDRLELFLKVCHAVQHAHQKGIIHRDLKPSNILVSLQDGVPVPKVIDFGIAKATQGRLTNATLFTAFEQFIGTPAYMSPEQAEMSGLDVDTRSDIYSLGILLYELLTGQLPFDPKALNQAGIDEIRRMIREVEPPRPSIRVSTLNDADRATVASNRGVQPNHHALLLRGDLDWIVMRCLEKDRTRRYETANALAQDVAHHLNDETVSARPPGRVYRLTKVIRRNRFAFGAGAAVVLTVAAAAVVSTILYLREHRALEAMRLAEQKASREAEISEAVSDFLRTDLLANASPEASSDRNLTLHTVVGRAAQRIDARFAQQPLVEAALRETLGETYHGLGDYVEMQKHFERAVELSRKHRGPNDPFTLECMSRVAEALRAQGRHGEAAEILRAVLTIQQQVVGVDHRKTLLTAYILAFTYRQQGRFREAETLMADTLERQKRVLPPGAADEWLSSMNGLALTRLALGQFEAGRALVRETLELRRKHLSAAAPDTLSSLHCVAFALQTEGRWAEAAALHEEALGHQRRVLGGEHPTTLRGTISLAAVHRTQGRLDEAAETFARILAAYRARLDGDHPNIALIQTELAEVRVRQEKPGEAEPLLREALASHTKVRPESWRRFHTMSVLGAAQLALGRAEEVESLLASSARGLLERQATIPAWELARVREAIERLVAYYVSRQRPREAAEWRVHAERFPPGPVAIAPL